MLSWPIAKDPDEYLDYEFDWSARLETAEQIATSIFIIEGSVTTDEETQTIAGGLTRLWLGGGTIGEVCRVTNRITTNQGRTYDQTSTLRIRAN